MRISSKHKKVGVIIGTGLLLIFAVYLNYKLNMEPVDEQTQTGGNVSITAADDSEDSAVFSGTNYFASFRENREAVRNKEIEYLDAIIADQKTDAETLEDAQRQKMAIVDGMEKEFTIESLLVAKGFEDAAVTIHEGSINVVVDSDSLTSDQVAKILDIVTRETGEKADNIKVSGKSQTNQD